jgi:DNA-binding NtrC family response regulator
MQAVRQKVSRAAGLNVPVLVLGESGTGKEVLARFIHERSPWR